MKSVPTCHREPEAKRSQPLVSGDCFASLAMTCTDSRHEPNLQISELGICRFADSLILLAAALYLRIEATIAIYVIGAQVDNGLNGAGCLVTESRL